MASLAGDPRRRAWWPIDGGNSQQARHPFVLFRAMSRCILHLAFHKHLPMEVADDEPCMMEGDGGSMKRGDEDAKCLPREVVVSCLVLGPR